MGLKKSYTTDGCKVTFDLCKKGAKDAKEVRLVGDFNGWNPNDPESIMKKKKDGSFSITKVLPKGKEFQFRYLLDGSLWENDWAADRYVPGLNSTVENSVVQTSSPD